LLEKQKVYFLAEATTPFVHNMPAPPLGAV